MTRAEAMIELVAKAMFDANNPEGGWGSGEVEEPRWTSPGSSTAGHYRRSARAALSAILPMLAEDLAGVAKAAGHREIPMPSSPQQMNGTFAEGAFAATKSATGAVKAHLASLAAAMKGEG